MHTINIFRNSKDFEIVHAGQHIFEENQPGNGIMYGVVEGEIEITIKGKLVETAGADSIIGELALVDHGNRSATAIAKTDCKLVRVDEKKFTFLVQQTPFFAIQVMQVMADRLRRWGEA